MYAALAVVALHGGVSVEPVAGWRHIHAAGVGGLQRCVYREICGKDVAKARDV